VPGFEDVGTCPKENPYRKIIVFFYCFITKTILFRPAWGEPLERFEQDPGRVLGFEDLCLEGLEGARLRGFGAGGFGGCQASMVLA